MISYLVYRNSLWMVVTTRRHGDWVCRTRHGLDGLSLNDTMAKMLNECPRLSFVALTDDATQPFIERRSSAFRALFG